jgi:thiol-disulfide isomerase/thioredoxin
MKNTFILASASWCGPCQVLKQRLTAAGLLDQVVVKDADTESSFFKEHDIKSVPRLIVYSPDGKLEKTISGVEEIYTAITQ